jgi:DNA polymerase-3 subunit gamma/tau
LDEIAVLAEGGMRDALSILDQLTAYCGDMLDITSLHEVYGLLSTAEKISILQNILDKNSGEILTAIDKINAQSLDIRRLTNELIEIIKECIVYNLTHNSALLSKSEARQVEAISEQADNKLLFNLIDLLLETAEKYKNASNANLYFETCLLKALNIEDKISPVEEVSPKPIPVNETKKVTEKPEEDQEYLLSLLLRADKENKSAVNSWWSNIENYCSNIDYARAANSLKQSEVFAAGDDFVIVCSDFEEIVLQINQSINSEMNIRLLNEIAKQPRKVFAITKVRSQQLIQDFRNLKEREEILKPAEIISFNLIEEVIEENPMFSIFGAGGIEVVE